MLATGLAISCGTTVKVHSDYDRSTDFTGYKTFSIYMLATTKNVNQLNEERIWNSIRQEMSKKGYVETTDRPDLLINAVSVLNNRKYVTANSNLYGYGGAVRPYGYWGVGRATGSTTFEAHDYKEGTLLIDVVDAQKNKLVWQGTGNAEINKAPKNPDAAIRDAVTKIMNSLPANNSVAKSNN